MRLIDTFTGELKYYINWEDTPPYAILSHTWGEHDREINMQQFMDDHRKLPSKLIGSLSKIEKFCNLARADGYHYAWADMVCIDKTNSTELSESLNLMYKWYRHSTVCYVYLSDVPEDGDVWHDESAFRKAKWFKRGWTLQELVAPRALVFYGQNWIEIGTKASLMPLITQITRIGKEILEPNYAETVSLGERLSWAAGRKTSRVEDRAYSLLGLLQIQLPILYGEGHYAFIRLQQELITRFDDQTIFAWREININTSVGHDAGLLATTPDDFWFFNGENVKLSQEVLPYTMTNGWLRISLPILKYRDPSGRRRCIGILNCKVQHEDMFYGIHLREQSGQYVRINPTQLEKIPFSKIQYLQPRLVYIKQLNYSHINKILPSKYSLNFVIQRLPRPEYEFSFTAVWGGQNDDLRAFGEQSETELWNLNCPWNGAVLLFENMHRGSLARWFVIVLGRRNKNVWADIVLDVEDNTGSLSQIARSYYADLEKLEKPGHRAERVHLQLDRVIKDLGTGNKVQLSVRPMATRIENDFNVEYAVFVDII